MEDARGLADPSLVGENVQKPGAPIPVRAIGVLPQPMPPTGNHVTDFGTQALETCLSGWGVAVSPKADLVLRSKLVKLFVTEANNYKGEARIAFRLEDAAGAMLWEGIVAADDSTWGSDLNPENYDLVLSNSLKKAYAELLNSPGFLAAWSGKPALAGERITPEAAQVAILGMMNEKLSPAVIAEWIRGKRITPALSAEDLVAWKRAGIPDEVTAAALPPRSQ